MGIYFGHFFKIDFPKKILTRHGMEYSCHAMTRQNMAWHSMPKYGMARETMAWHGMTWHGMAWHGATLRMVKN